MKRGNTKKSKKVVAPKANLSLVTEPSVFFKEKLSQALHNQKLKPHPHTEFYLVNLLSQFMVSENLFTTDENGTKRNEVLALLLKEAVDAPDAAAKQKGLQRLGDVSLYTAGFFSDSLARKTVDVDYYIGMGSQAYSSLSTILPDAAFQIVFSELADRFSKFVSVLCEISHTTLLGNTKDILRMYELWLKTGSEHLENSLKKLGIMPNKLIKPSAQ